MLPLVHRKMLSSLFIDLIGNFHKKHILVGGHRGHLSETRENTIPNFTGLLNSGIEYIKIDIQLTRDDEAVIFHDRESSSATNSQKPIPMQCGVSADDPVPEESCRRRMRRRFRQLPRSASVPAQ